MKALAAEIDSTFLAAVSEVMGQSKPLLITINGKAAAKLVPLTDPLDQYLFPGEIEIIGDIMAPLYTDAEYEEFFQASLEQSQ